MITTREFFTSDADNIIQDLETYWTVQRDGNNKYINVSFPDKEEFLDRYESGLDDPYDELSDYDNISSEEEQQMIQEQKAVCILLTLLHLGIKDIRLGPTLPAFISPNVLNY